RQSPQQEPTERVRTPARAFRQGLTGGQGALIQTQGQIVPVGGGEVQVVVDGVSIEAVVADGVAAHDQDGQADPFEGRDDLGQARRWVHRRESSHPRLPWRRYRTSRGCRPNSSSDRGLRSSCRTSGRLALRTMSSASAAVAARPSRRRRVTGSCFKYSRSASSLGISRSFEISLQEIETVTPKELPGTGTPSRGASCIKRPSVGVRL